MSNNTENASRTTEAQIQNGTSRDEYITTILNFVSIPVLILGLIGNGVVFQILCCKVKKTNYTVYILNLAIADFTVLFCYTSFSVLSLIIWRTFDFEGFLFVVLDILWFFGYNSSVFLLTAISVERYLGVFYPFWYHSNRPEHLSVILCTLVWVISCLVTVVEYFTCWSEFEMRNQCSTNYMAASIFLVIIFLIFTPVMVLCSLIMFVKVQTSSQLSSSTRLYLTIAVTIVIFLVFALPGRFACLIGYWHPEAKWIWNVIEVSFFLNIVNSTLNPFVYFFIGKQNKPGFKEPLSVVFQRSWNHVTQDHKDTTEEA